MQSGRCQVKYYVAFRNSLGTLLDTGIGYNIGKMKACSSKDYGVITDVELTISFKAISKFLTAKVSKPHSITNTAQTTLPFQHATAKPTVPPLPPGKILKIQLLLDYGLKSNLIIYRPKVKQFQAM